MRKALRLPLAINPNSSEIVTDVIMKSARKKAKSTIELIFIVIIGSLPFLLIMLLMIGALIYFPGIVLWLPDRIMGRV